MNRRDTGDSMSLKRRWRHFRRRYGFPIMVTLMAAVAGVVIAKLG